MASLSFIAASPCMIKEILDLVRSVAESGVTMIIVTREHEGFTTARFG
jgi:ABC-type polar amino acid transport system ATPase subunit